MPTPCVVAKVRAVRCWGFSLLICTAFHVGGVHRPPSRSSSMVYRQHQPVCNPLLGVRIFRPTTCPSLRRASPIARNSIWRDGPQSHNICGHQSRLMDLLIASCDGGIMLVCLHPSSSVCRIRHFGLVSLQTPQY
jgi:hypothetical protein